MIGIPVWFGRVPLLPGVAHHHAVKYGDKWYEIEGTGQKTPGPNVILTNKGELSTNGAKPEYQVQCYTTMQEKDIEQFNADWLRDHPTYYVFGDNCQVFARDLLKFLCPQTRPPSTDPDRLAEASIDRPIQGTSSPASPKVSSPFPPFPPYDDDHVPVPRFASKPFPSSPPPSIPAPVPPPSIWETFPPSPSPSIPAPVPPPIICETFRPSPPPSIPAPVSPPIQPMPVPAKQPDPGMSSAAYGGIQSAALAMAVGCYQEGKLTDDVLRQTIEQGLVGAGSSWASATASDALINSTGDAVLGPLGGGVVGSLVHTGYAMAQCPRKFEDGTGKREQCVGEEAMKGAASAGFAGLGFLACGPLCGAAAGSLSRFLMK